MTAPMQAARKTQDPPVGSLVRKREIVHTHQVRIHLAELGHPLCGEKVYNQPLFGKPLTDESGAPRLALHAAELGFEHPITGEPMRFGMALPDDLAEFVKGLRQQAK